MMWEVYPLWLTYVVLVLRPGQLRNMQWWGVLSFPSLPHWLQGALAKSFLPTMGDAGEGGRRTTKKK